MTQDRERLVAETFVSLADTLIDDFDVIEFLSMFTERCVELLAYSAAGVILLGPGDELQVAATSSHRAELLELFATQTNDGPCIDCIRTRRPTSSTDLTMDGDRWPRFAAAANECGFRAVHTVPMRLRNQVVGVLSLLNSRPAPVDTSTVRLAQALADVATIGILQHRHIERSDQVSEQLQAALTSRVLIEQAKGVLGQRGGLSMDEAFTHLRAYARNNNLRLTLLARTISENTADLDAILLRPVPKH